jgi:outer membrane receptor protein involved in Fe transport
MNKFIKFLATVALVMGFQIPAFAQGAFEEVVVTAQRIEESLQDVPIAVTALSSDDLDEKQIITFSDLQLNVPGLNFGQTNFGGASINIRGIGRLSTGASFDQSVSYHVNESPIATSGVGIEQYDVERVEVLRGPQGTLYGRGATAGAINVVTNKPSFDGNEGRVKVTAGNYNTQKIEAMFNYTVSDNIAVRFAGYDLQRDGYIDNLFMPNDDYNGRDQTGGRFSFAWDGGPTQVNLLFENYNENSTRALKGRYVCKNSPRPNRGCVLGGQESDSDLANPAGVYDGIIAAVMLKSAPPAANVDQFIALGALSGNEIRPANMTARQTHANFTPVWQRDSDVYTLNIDHELDMGSIGFTYTGYTYHGLDRGDSDMAVNPRNLKVDANAAGGYSLDDTLYPMINSGVRSQRGVTAPTIAEEMAGNLANLYQSKYILVNSNRGEFIDGTNFEGADKYAELKFASSFDGPHNFLLGINSYEVNVDSRYLTASSPLATLAAGVGYYPSIFGTATNFDLEAQGVFGEYYYQINDEMKLTIGARFSDETKTETTFLSSYKTATDVNSAAYDSLTNAVGAGYGFKIASLGQANHGWSQTGDGVFVHGSLDSCISPSGILAKLLDPTVYTDNACGTSADEVIALSKVDTGVDYNAAITSANTAFLQSAGAILAGGGSNAAAVVGSAAEYVALVNAVAQVPSMYVTNTNFKKPGWPSYGANVLDYETTAGRVVFDWQYDNNSMMFVSLARGTKPAGINPGANPRIYPPCYAGSTGGVSWTATSKADGCVDIPATTNKEVVDTLEVGVKTDLLNGQLRVNASAYAMKYDDLQIASIVEATTFNFNSDADIYGADVELIYVPEANPNLRIDAMVSFLDTEITSDDFRLNAFNKLATGTPDDISATHVEIKCTALLYQATSACVGNNFVVKKSDLLTAIGTNTYSNATEWAGNNPSGSDLVVSGSDFADRFENVGLTNSQAAWLSDLGTLPIAALGMTETTFPAYGDRNVYDVAGTTQLMNIATTNGVTSSIKGNSLPQAPETSINLSASYTYNMSNGYTLIPSATYYYQDEMFSTEFNATISDVIEEWDEINLGLLVIPANGDWTLKVYARNVTDEDNVTMKYNSTDVTGNFQTWQYRDPRTAGVEFTMQF